MVHMRSEDSFEEHTDASKQDIPLKNEDVLKCPIICGAIIGGERIIEHPAS